MTVASLQDWTPGPDRQARRRTADYARRRYQASRAGQWAPFTDPGPVREHLQALREAGVTLEQIGGVAGVSVATLSRAAKEPRMTSTAADAIMAIPVPAAHPDERPGAAVAEKLRTLVADGWTLVQIAEATGLSERALQRQTHEQVPPMRGTVEAIDRAYDQLIVEDPGDGYIAARARARAERALGEDSRCLDSRRRARVIGTGSLEEDECRFGAHHGIPGNRPQFVHRQLEVTRACLHLLEFRTTRRPTPQPRAQVGVRCA